LKHNIISLNFKGAFLTGLDNDFQLNFKSHKKGYIYGYKKAGNEAGHFLKLLIVTAITSI